MRLMSGKEPRLPPEFWPSRKVIRVVGLLFQWIGTALLTIEAVLFLGIALLFGSIPAYCALAFIVWFGGRLGRSVRVAKPVFLAAGTLIGLYPIIWRLIRPIDLPFHWSEMVRFSWLRPGWP